MQVELTVERAGKMRLHKVGEIMDLPDSEAIRLIENGDAIPVRSKRVETTSRRRPRRK